LRVIATDLDRTLIPNGGHIISKGAMNLFGKLLKKNGVKLVYVTGRNKKLIENAIRRYNMPKPDYVVGFVGVVIYEYKRGKLVEVKSWQKELEKACGQCRRESISKLLRDIKELKEQESKKLHDFKQSYYVSLKVGRSWILRKIRRRLKYRKIDAEVIFSVDVTRKIGLIDILPRKGTKIAALKAVLRLLNVKDKRVMYCGDSGNDLLPLSSGFNAVLVKNAGSDVREELIKVVERKKLIRKVYFPKGDFEVQGFKGKLNGNYVSGIIEGAFHFRVF
jgi:sucrose-6-phosphatase